MVAAQRVNINSTYLNFIMLGDFSKFSLQLSQGQIKSQTDLFLFCPQLVQFWLQNTPTLFEVLLPFRQLV